MAENELRKKMVLGLEYSLALTLCAMGEDKPPFTPEKQKKLWKLWRKTLEDNRSDAIEMAGEDVFSLYTEIADAGIKTFSEIKGEYCPVATEFTALVLRCMKLEESITEPPTYVLPNLSDEAKQFINWRRGSANTDKLFCRFEAINTLNYLHVQHREYGHLVETMTKRCFRCPYNFGIKKK